MPKNITIYHNPRCSKSRAALEYLNQHGDQITVIEYLKNPPSAATIESLLDRLDLKAGELIRRGEAAYKELNLDETSNDRELVDAMAANPVLIERPIVVSASAAVIGRPLDKIIRLLDDDD